MGEVKMGFLVGLGVALAFAAWTLAQALLGRVIEHGR
jgi:hypothetical protein